MNTDTPRTNEAVILSDGQWCFALAFCSRQLERELAKAKGEIKKLKEQLTQTHGSVTISRNGYVEELEKQRDRLAEAQQAYDNLRKTLSAVKCPICHNQRMIPSDDPDGDVMNTPCPECNSCSTS